MDNMETVVYRMLLAVVAGSLIGLERTHHGRPAGLRTHTLVCAASCLLMLFTEFQWKLVPSEHLELVRVDPTRMGQGIMTGIGFLGAGVIMKERFTVRGLTTAGSLWMTASIGIIIGVGLYFAAFVAAFLTIVVLSIFRLFEGIMPTLHYGKLSVRFKASDVITKEELSKILSDCNVTGFAPSYHLDDEGRYFKYEMTVRSRSFESFNQLSGALQDMETVKEFTLIPTGD